MSASAKELLELTVDAVGINKTLELLAAVCGEKAEHIRVNWQDAPLAKSWDKASETIEVARRRVCRTAQGLK
jgi:hypothetical protein